MLCLFFLMQQTTWERETDKKIQKNTVKRRMNDLLRQEQLSLEERRDRYMCMLNILCIAENGCLYVHIIYIIVLYICTYLRMCGCRLTTYVCNYMHTASLCIRIRRYVSFAHTHTTTVNI